MTAEQIEKCLMIVGFVFATLIGYGVIPVRPDNPNARKAVESLRVIGPLGTLLGIALLAMSMLK